MIRVQIVTDEWSPISASIRFTTRSWASHAEFVSSEGFTLGARADGVKIRPSYLDHYSKVEQFVFNDAMSPAIILGAYQWARTQIGKKYDFAAIVGIAADRNLQLLLKAETPVAAVVGKTWDLHVREALRIPLEENLEILHDTIAFRVIVKSSKPYLAAVEGWAAGAGFSIALCCDTIVAGTGARFVAAFPKVGLVVRLLIGQASPLLSATQAVLPSGVIAML